MACFVRWRAICNQSFRSRNANKRDTREKYLFAVLVLIGTLLWTRDIIVVYCRNQQCFICISCHVKPVTINTTPGIAGAPWAESVTPLTLLFYVGKMGDFIVLCRSLIHPTAIFITIMGTHGHFRYTHAGSGLCVHIFVEYGADGWWKITNYDKKTFQIALQLTPSLSETTSQLFGCYCSLCQLQEHLLFSSTGNSAWRYSRTIQTKVSRTIFANTAVYGLLVHICSVNPLPPARAFRHIGLYPEVV